MAAQRGLGKGLDALFQSGTEKEVEGDIKHLPIDRIEPNPYQPRRSFSDESLKELALSIRSQGVLQPLLVRIPGAGDAAADSPQRYELIAGERRLRAAKLCGLRTVPAIVRTMTDDQSLILAMIENLQREDLNPLDEAAGLASLQKRLGANQDDLARAVGKSRSAIANALRLLHLPEEVQSDIREGRISAGHGRSLLGIEDPDIQKQLHQRILSEQLSVRHVEHLAAYVREHGHLPAEGHETPQPKGRAARKAPAALPPELNRLQQQLTDTLSLRVSLRGTAEQGKMVLAYNSEEELQALLSRLGLEQ